MARAKRRQPYDPSKAHDRRATEFNRGAQVTPIEIDDPYAAGEKIIAMRSTRNDPLAGMHARKTIDEAQYWGGRAFQRDFEAAERGPRAIDPGKEFVDGGALPEPITESQRKAAKQLAVAHRALGADGSAIVHDVLIHGWTIIDVASSRGLAGRKWEDHFTTKFLDCLDILAKLWGLSNGSRPS